MRAPADLDPLLVRIGEARVVAVEGDRPDCYRVDRSVRLHAGADEDPRDALDAFARWPTWMWADDVVDFCLERPGEHVPVAASDA